MFRKWTMKNPRWREKILQGTSAFYDRDFDSASKLFEEAVNIAIEDRLSPTMLIESYLLLGSALIENEKLCEAESILLRASKFSTMQGCDKDELQLRLLTKLGMLEFFHDKIDECIATLGESLSLHARLKLQIDDDYLDTVLMLSKCHFTKQNWRLAQRHSRTACNTSRKLNGIDHYLTKIANRIYMIASWRDCSAISKT